MPIYDFINTKTNEEFTDMMSIAEMEKLLLENPHIKKAWNKAPSLTGDHIMGVGPKTDMGFNENMQRISAAHPTSPLADKYGSGATHKRLKTIEAARKYTKKFSSDK